VTLDMPGLTGGAVEALYARGTAWLSGKLMAFSGEVAAASPQKTRQSSRRA